MTRLGSLAAGSLAIVLFDVGLWAQDRPVFKSGADVVLVDVSVRKGQAPVQGLKVSDFQLLDKNVLQKIESVSQDAVPMDLSLIVDSSISVSGESRNRLMTSVKDIAGLLHADDTFSLVLVSDRIEVVPPSQFYHRVSARPRHLGDGGTVLYDAIVASLMEPAQPGRRHLILTLSDAVDTNSVTSDAALQATISRSDAVLYMVAVSDSSRGWAFERIANIAVPTTFDSTLSRLIVESGGRVLGFDPSESLVEPCRRIMDEIRSRYTLRYTPEGNDQGGWHDLAVKVGSGEYEVLARRGYFRRQ